MSRYFIIALIWTLLSFVAFIQGLLSNVTYGSLVTLILCTGAALYSAQTKRIAYVKNLQSENFKNSALIFWTGTAFAVGYTLLHFSYYF